VVGDERGFAVRDGGGFAVRVPGAMTEDLLAGLEAKLEGIKITEDKEEVMNAQIVKDYNMWVENKP
jgi:hypothetical protein